MKKSKLIDARMKKGFSQKKMADALNMDVSNYNRREAGEIKINNQQWEKISDLLSVPLLDIYESDESNLFVFKDSSTGNYLGTNHIYSIPEYMLQTQHKYFGKIEEENKELRVKNETLEKEIRELRKKLEE